MRTLLQSSTVRSLLGGGALFSLWLAAPARAASRDRQPLDTGWKFHLGDMPGAQQPDFMDRDWRQVDVPHDWSIGGTPDPDAPSGAGGGYFPTGIGWYRRSFDAPESWRGRIVTVEFEGVTRNATVWLNGHDLGFHPYPYTPFSYDLSPWLKLGAANVLAVRVDDSAQPASRWYAGAGLTRPVWLQAVDPVHVAPQSFFVETVSASAETATLRVRADLRNDSDSPQSVTFMFQVMDRRMHFITPLARTVTIAAHGDFNLTQEFTLPRPRLWSPATPVLYQAHLWLRANRHPVDQAETYFGVRTIAVSAARGFELNGIPLKLDGGDVHDDNGPLGGAAYAASEFRRAELLKAAGFNAIRAAHNPPSPAFLDACDRLGLLVIDEAFDGWVKPKQPHDYSAYFPDWWQRDLDAMVLRDRHHPSVVMWSIGNEPYERGTPEGAKLAHELAARVRALDPTRPVTAGINGLGKDSDWPLLDPLFAALDVAGYNYAFPGAAEDHARVPARVMVSTESYQSQTFAAWAAVQDHPYLIGDFVWSAMDYLGEAGIGRVFPPDIPARKPWFGNQYPWHGALCGDIDLTGWSKPAAHYRNIVWDRGEKLYAAVIAPTPDGRPWNLAPWAMPPALPSWTWPGQEGKPLEVEVFSRHQAVRLYLNGRPLAERLTSRAQEFKAVFTVPYEPGTLKIAGLDDDRETETFTLTTAGPAAKIRLLPASFAVNGPEPHLTFVTVEITDARNRLRPDADNSVSYTLSGPGVIAGLGNADMTSTESYQANPHRVFQGRALVIVRDTSAAGKITLTASSPGLKSQTLVVRPTLSR